MLLALLVFIGPLGLWYCGIGSMLDQGKHLTSAAELDMYTENNSLFVHVFVLFPEGVVMCLSALKYFLALFVLCV